MKSIENNLKKGKYSLYFKQLFNEYMKHKRSLKLQFELVYNPNKLFLEDIYKKKRDYDMQKENMNIAIDLFDGRKIDIDQQKYLNHNSKNGINFLTQSSSKISQFLLIKKGIKYNHKKSIIHKSLSQNIFSNKNKQKQKLKFPKIIFETEKRKNQIASHIRKNIKIDDNNNFKRTPLTNMKYRKSFISLKKYIPKNSKIFNYYKTNYYNQMKILTNESKIISKNLSDF